jgi:hypothetical protein
MTAKVVYTEFVNLKSIQGELKTDSLQHFAALCAASYAQKKAQPLCVPDVLPGNRRASGVEPISASAIFLDFDKPQLTARECAQRLKKLGASFVLYPTYSWTEAQPKYRIVLPFGAPQDIVTRRNLIARMEKVLPGIAPESYDSKRGYFVGRNGRSAPDPVWFEKLPAEQVQWPAADPAPKEARVARGISGNPAQLAQTLVAKAGHKLVDGEGRWSAVEYLATRVSARNYSELECYALLDELVGRYFDASAVTPEDRSKWNARIAYWLAKDKPLQALRARPEERIVPTFNDLPTTFSIGELMKMDLPPTEWVVEDLLPPGLALLAGPPKIGKSTLAYDLAMAVASGSKFLDHWATRKAPVIYYDLESGHHLIKEKVVALLRVRKHDVRKWKLSFSLVSPAGAAAVAQVRADLQANPATRLLVVDIFARFRDAAQEARERKNAYLLEHEIMTQFQAVCMDYPNLCVLLVHHTNKRSTDTTTWQDAISGTQGIAGGTHTNLVLSSPVKPGLSEEDRQLMRQYVILHGAGKRVHEFEQTLAKAGDGCTWRVSELTPGQVKAGSVQRDILAVVSSNPEVIWPAPAIAQALGKNLNTVRELTRRMTQQGMLKTTGKGFILPQNAETAKRVASQEEIFGPAASANRPVRKQK